jgi:hypothetical protein
VQGEQFDEGVFTRSEAQLTALADGVVGCIEGDVADAKLAGPGRRSGESVPAAGLQFGSSNA